LRTLAAVTTGIAVISTVVTANLWRELYQERKLTAGLRAEMAGSAGHVRTLLQGSRLDVRELAPPSDNPDAVMTAAPPPPPPGGLAPGTDISEQELLKDPAYRKTRLVTLRSTIEQDFPGLAEELGLTGEESARLFAVLAETRLAMAAEAPVTDGQQVEPAVAAQVTRIRRALLKQQSDSLRALLGDARYARWQEYRQTQAVRLRANAYATALARSGVPLDSFQTRTMTTTMIAEHERLEQDILALGGTVVQANPETRIQALETLKNRQADSNQHVLDAASRFMSAQQVEILRRQIALQGAAGRAVPEP